MPFHDAWLVRTEPTMDTPDRIVHKEALFDEGIRVLGYDIQSDALMPGETVEVRVYWQPTEALSRDYSSFAQLLGPQGVVGQGDIVHRSQSYLPGEIRADIYRFPLLLHTPPGAYRLITGFYYTDDAGWHRLASAGQDHLTLTLVDVRAATHSMATQHPLIQDYANGLRLTGLDYDQTVLGQTRIYMHWTQPRVLPIGRGPWRVADGGPTLVQAVTDGQVIAQANIPQLAAGSSATVALDIPGAVDGLQIALSEAGSTVRRLGPWHTGIMPALALSLPRETSHYVPLGGEMVYVGHDRLPDAAAGADVWLSPRLLALRPLTDDYAVSVGVRQGDAEFKADGTPALGAIPSLKWVRGWLVEDPHLVTLGPGAAAGEAMSTLQVYDAFTLQPLAVLDERLVREGQGTTLQTGTLRIE
jgi:hypothetical protein